MSTAFATSVTPLRASSLRSFHLEAGIASCHAVAPSYDATDWPTILGYYEALAALNPSPILTLNRAVALAMVDGPAAGLSLIDTIQDHPSLKRYYLLPATRGELHRRLGQGAQARTHYARALELAAAEPVRRFLRKRITAPGYAGARTTPAAITRRAAGWSSAAGTRAGP